jgi:hypothetical protein
MFLNIFTRSAKMEEKVIETKDFTKQEANEIEKQRQGKFHSEEIIDTMLKESGYKGIL